MTDKNKQLMLDAGSKKGQYDPEAPDQWRWVMHYSECPEERAMAWVKSKTTAFHHDSAFCVDEHGKPLYIEHMAVDLGWAAQTARNVLGRLEKQGRVRFQGKRIWYCADIPQAHPEAGKTGRREGEVFKLTQSYPWAYLVDFIRELPEAQKQAAEAKLKRYIPWRREFFADVMAVARMEADRIEDSILLSIGLPKKRLPKRRESESKWIQLKLVTEPDFEQSYKSPVQTAKVDFVDARAVVSTAAATEEVQPVPRHSSSAQPINKGKSSSSSSSSALSKSDDDGRTRTKPKTTEELGPVAEAMQVVGITEARAVKQLFGLCRDEAPDCTPDEVGIWVRRKIQIKAGKRVPNWTGYLHTSVPPMFSAPGFGEWRNEQRAFEQEKTPEPTAILPPEDPTTEWAQVKQRLRKLVSPEGYANWLEPTRQISRSGGSLRIRVPDHETKNWLITEYGTKIADELLKVGLVCRYIVFAAPEIAQGAGS